MELLVRMKVHNRLACNAMGTDGSSQCHIALMAKEYVKGKTGLT